ncbi:MAG: KilA-N domain-containing protein [Nostoc sp.]|uniref:KilA-N domain-containing protein n=1 Tax=Nostoc sp. TaxID=1180 RepID=UPI002FF72C26
MLTHFWHDSEINQMPQDGEIGKYLVPKGYVNASQMCKANGKFLADYTKLKSTKQYLQALSNDMKILISLLVMDIQGYGSEQSTWIHPEIAIDLARWVSVEFRIWANRTLMKVMLSNQVEPIQQQEPTHSLAPSHEAAQLAMMLGEFAGLDKSLTAQLAVNAATKVNPALKPAADELKTAIASTNTAEDAFLNPTQIGEVVGMPNQFAVRNYGGIWKFIHLGYRANNFNYGKNKHVLSIFRASAFMGRVIIANCELRIANWFDWL